MARLNKVEDEGGSQMSIDIDSLVEARIQQQIEEIKSRAYKEALQDVLKKLPPGMSFGDFLSLLENQKQGFLDYIHSLPLSTLAESLGGGEVLKTHLNELREVNAGLVDERDQLLAEVARLKAAPRPGAESSAASPSPRRRSSSEEIRQLNEAFGQPLLTFLRGRGPQTIGEIARGLGVDSGELKRPIADLLAGGKLKKEGEKRATRYTTAEQPD